jgi:hypothetical protein
VTLELVVVIRRADPGTEDGSGSRGEDHVVKVRQALYHEVAESPYLARQLLVFNDRQLITRLPGMMTSGLRRTLNSVVNARDDDLY